MSEGRVIKWLLRDDNIRIYIMESYDYDIIVKEKLKTVLGKYQFKMTAVIKRHDDQLTIWIPPNVGGLDGWMSKIVKDANEIRERYEIPLTDGMLEVYDALLLVQNLNK